MKDKSVIWWLVFVVLAVWQLPQLLVSLVMIPFLGKLELLADRHFNLCFIASDMVGGVSLGPLCFVSPRMTGPESVAHELDGHTVQSKLLGPLYLLVIGIPSLLNAWLGLTKCYYDFYTESWCNRCAGLTVDNNCHLVFKPNA